MTPLFPTPDHYLYNLIAMTSPEAKRLWRRSIKEYFGKTCVYCGETYELHELTLDHVHPRTYGGEDITSNLVPCCKKCNQAREQSLVDLDETNIRRQPTKRITYSFTH